jgi:hypothetical protein
MSAERKYVELVVTTKIVVFLGARKRGCMLKECWSQKLKNLAISRFDEWTSEEVLCPQPASSLQ